MDILTGLCQLYCTYILGQSKQQAIQKRYNLSEIDVESDHCFFFFHTQFQCGRWLATRVPHPSTSWSVTTTPALTWPSPTSPAWASGESGSSTRTHNRVWPSAAWCVLRLASLMQWRWAVWMCQWQHCRTALSG